MTKIEVTIKNKAGLHARPSTKIAQVAAKYASSIILSNNGVDADAKSVISLMLLVADKGSTITITADGPDEKEAIEELKDLIEVRQFDEE